MPSHRLNILFLSFIIIATPSAYASDFILKSSEVKNGENINKKFLADGFGCQGENVRPNLFWQNPPKGVKSYAISLYDKDADTGSGFWHWQLVDIPPASNSIGVDIPVGAIVKANDTGADNYLGPCPPIGSVHTYTFTIHALNIDKLEAPANSTAPLTGYFINKHTIAKASLNLRVSRKS
ncbi:hypothetical protein PEKONANI_03531 [Aeromonas jandaei]|uniref:YbhB/YbcL family Raf kinase inhibitor-like protein n=1 Tax=Aeromonas jandaei TaxID=650 RepID=UPI00366C1BF9